MKITQTQLDEIVALHDKWLRSEPGGVRANLCGANLAGANLRWANLCEANLRWADLRWADLYGAILRGAILGGANLYAANLTVANLSGAILRGANLSGANLAEANLAEANLSGANLRYCIGNSQEVKLVQTSRWTVTYTAEVMAIGCEQHAIAKWWAFTDREIARMDREALDWWRTWKPILQQLIKASPAAQTSQEGEHDLY